ncbi:MAG TPA: DUF1501 domain-containing protein [Acidimicrobiales bacterium]
MTDTRPTDPGAPTPGPTTTAAWAASLHPECPDVSRLGPTPAEGLLRARAARVRLDREQRQELWRGGFTRRRFLAGGLAGVAALGTQLVTTRVSFAAPGAAAAETGTLVVIFMRGGVDGLSMLVPVDDPALVDARPDIAIPGSALLPLDGRFGLHPALAPLHAHWGRGQLTAVPAVSTTDVSRSHFQAQDCLERGGAASGTVEGWLDRVLDRLGPGSTFRAIGQGSTLPRSLAGDQSALSLNSIEAFGLAGWEGVHDKTILALTTLYTGFEHSLSQDVAATLSALDTAETLTAAEYQPAATYPDGDFAKGLTELARLIKADVGLRVACIDVGGWDMHTNIGTLDGGSMKDQLTSFGEALGAFAADLGPALGDVTVVAMTEFGRRVEQNANRGTDHGHGSVVLLLGGGLAGGATHGDWPGLAPDARDQGDVAGANDSRDVLGDVVAGRLGLSAADVAAIFPDHQYRPLGIMA